MQFEVYVRAPRIGSTLTYICLRGAEGIGEKTHPPVCASCDPDRALEEKF